MGAPVEVEAVDCVGVRTKVVLGAALRGQILVVTAILGDLKIITAKLTWSKKATTII